LHEENIQEEQVPAFIKKSAVCTFINDITKQATTQRQPMSYSNLVSGSSNRQTAHSCGVHNMSIPIRINSSKAFIILTMRVAGDV
jgi:hypothetical protein